MLWTGRLVSNIGDSIYAIVLSWFILEITQSALWVGILNFAIFVPNVFAFIFGQIIDKSNKKKALILAEIGQLVPITIIAIMIFIELFNPWIICILVFIAATFGMNTYIIQDALVPQIVEEQDLPRAQTYLSFAYSGTDYLFNALAGVLISLLSYFQLIIINIFSFLLSIIFFRKIKYETATDNNDPVSEKFNLFEGFRFILKNNLLLIITVCSLVINFVFGGLNVYQVLIAHAMGGAQYLGLLASLGAIGSLLGSSIIANVIFKYIPVGKVLVIFHLLSGLLFIMTSLVTSHKISFLSFWLLSFMMLGVTQVIQVPVLQKLIPSHKIGTVMSSFYTLTVTSLPLGALFFGAIGENLSGPMFLAIFGITLFLISVCYFSSKNITNLKMEE